MRTGDRSITSGYSRAVSEGSADMTARLPSAQIESFMVLARELNFSRAAELLHITQPALTKRIQNLEETLG